MKMYLNKKILLFLPILFFCCYAGTVSAKPCEAPLRLSMGPDETQKFGDIFASYFKRFGPGREFVNVSYYSNIFKKKGAKSCHTLDLELEFSSDGKKILTPKTVDLTFYSLSNSAKYGMTAARVLEIFADDKSVFKGSLERNLQTFSRKTTYEETLSTELDFPAFEKMAQAKAVSISLGAIKIDLTATQLKAIKQMYSLIEK